MSNRLTPQQAKELAEKELKEKYDAEMKKIQDEFEQAKRKEPPESAFDKLIEGVIKVPKPKTRN
jgi:hypothetical protein